MSTVYILTAPSGAGKTSLMSKLRDQNPELEFSISATTRAPRHYERDAKDYYFMSLEDFQENIQNNAFIEYEEVYPGKYYGTLKSEIERILSEGKIPILDIDVNGALRIKKKYGDDVVVVFIAPPSTEVLKERLENRGTESSNSLEQRLKRAEYELSQSEKFDYKIINDNFDDALAQLQDIFTQKN